MMSANKSLLRVLAALMILGAGISGGPRSVAHIRTLTNAADLVVVATITDSRPGDSSVDLSLSVERTLAGQIQPSSGVQARYSFPVGYRGSLQVTKDQKGLWFLKSTVGAWQVLPAEEGGPSFRSVYYAVGPAPSARYAYTSQAPVLEKVLNELAAAAEYYDGGEGYANRWATAIDFDGSALLETIYRGWTQSASARMRLMGLIGLIPRGDVPALLAAEKDAALFADLPGKTFLMFVVTGFHAPDPNAVHALGRLATAGSGPRGYLVFPAAYALRSVHTREALPYLKVLLDHTDRSVRELAVAGFGAFSLGMPVILPGTAGAEAIHTGLNPGRKDIPAGPNSRTKWTQAEVDEIRRHVRMGSFANDRDEAECLFFWKGWWARNSAQLLEP